MRAVNVCAVALVFASGCAVDAPAMPVAAITIDTQTGPKALTVELASDPASQERGLMFRRELAADRGMLFDFHNETRLSFWMKNTVLRLDILFIRANGTISTIVVNAIPYSTALMPSAEPVRAVLEINGGRAHQLGIRTGDRVHAAIFHNVDRP